MEIAKLLENGGREWKTESKHRIYFNDLATRVGLSVTRYGTGNVSSARLDGAEISNSKARQLLSRLDLAKFYFDVATGQFVGQNLTDSEVAKIQSSIVGGSCGY